MGPILEIHKGSPKGFGGEESNGDVRFSKSQTQFSGPRRRVWGLSLKFIRVHRRDSGVGNRMVISVSQNFKLDFLDPGGVFGAYP